MAGRRTRDGREIPERSLERKEVNPTAVGLVAVLAFVVFAYIPFMGKAYNMDEPLFLAPARHILRDPWHPLAFSFNWYGQTLPMSRLNNTPPLFLYLLAMALKCTGGQEFPTRLFFLPLDFLTAVSLYLLAARFLKKPLWPALVVLASPGYLVGLNLLYPDKAAAAFGFFGLYAWIHGVDEQDSLWRSLGAGSLALAVLSKYLAGAFLVPAAAYVVIPAKAGIQATRPRLTDHRGDIIKKTVPLAAAFMPVGLYLGFNLWHGGAAFSSAWRTTAQSLGETSWLQRWRAVPAFAGGCCAAAALWPFLAFKPRPKTALLALVAAVLIFLPAWDGVDRVGGLDRALGAAMAFAFFYGLVAIATDQRNLPGRALWCSWIGAILLAQLFIYWSVMARVTALLVPPFVFASAAGLEKRLKLKNLAALYAGSFAVILALSLTLAWVDSCYADAQRQAAQAAARMLGPGERLWTSSHWGLQYYVEQAGGRELNSDQGGWDEVRPGDVVLSSLVNSNAIVPHRRFLIDAKKINWENPVCLRLMSGRDGQAGFYSSVFGFLSYALSREPLDEFFFARILKVPKKLSSIERPERLLF